MPNESNLPADYNRYLGLAKVSKQKAALKLLNRFAFRYRLAEDFEGLVAPKVGRTLEGYDVITKIFLAYTAYEAIVKAGRKLGVSSVLPHHLNTRFDKKLAISLRTNERLKSYLLSYPFEPSLKNKLGLFFGGITSDIICVAYAIRNVFSHGDLTASAIGTETIAKRKVLYGLANSLLDYCDETFTECIERI